VKYKKLYEQYQDQIAQMEAQFEALGGDLSKLQKPKSNRPSDKRISMNQNA
jgi:hypothetical protein